MPAIDTTAIRDTITNSDANEALSFVSAVLAGVGFVGLGTAAVGLWVILMRVVAEVLGPMILEQGLQYTVTMVFELPMWAAIAYGSVYLANSLDLGLNKKRAALVAAGIYSLVYVARVLLNTPYGVG